MTGANHLDDSATFSYVVRTAIRDANVFDGFVRWLRERHLDDVCAAGAVNAELVVLDTEVGDPMVVEARYRFESRDAFRVYERDHAPRLRTEGLAELARLVGVGGRDVTFARSTGQVMPKTT